jgi:hypothetical protein
MTHLRPVLVAAATVLLAAFAPAVPAVAAVRAAASVDPTVVSFGVLAPGLAASRDVVLTADEPSDGEVVRVTVAGTGNLLDHVTTGLRSCATAWSGDACPGGAATLLAGWQAGDAPATTSVPVAAQGTLHLRVDVAVDATAPQAASAELTYTLRLQGVGTPPPAPPVTPTPPLASTGSNVLAGAAAAVALVMLGSVLVDRSRRGRAR